MKQHCSNCGNEISNRYCSFCGQRCDVGRLTFGSVYDGLLSTIVGEGFGGEKGVVLRYGVFRTLWLIFRHPHITIAEYLSGKQRKYFNPITMLMLLSAVYALVLQFVKVESSGVGERVADDSKVVNLSTNVLRYASDYIEQHPAMTSIVLIPFFALCFRWLFRKFSKLNYVEYLYIEIIISIIIIPISLVNDVLSYYWAWYNDCNWMGVFIFIFPIYFRASIYRHVLNVDRRRIIYRYVLGFILSYAIITLICALALVLLILTTAGQAIAQ